MMFRVRFVDCSPRHSVVSPVGLRRDCGERDEKEVLLHLFEPARKLGSLADRLNSNAKANK